MHESEEPPRPSLSFEARVEEGALLATYRLSNPGPKAAFAFDAVTPEPDPWPDRTKSIYVSFRAPDAVQMKHVIPPLPRRYRVPSITVPPATRTGPGLTRIERFRLPLPLRERSSFFVHHENARYRDETAARVVLVLGWLWEDEARAWLPGPLPGAFLPRDFLGPPQRLISAAVPLEVPVRVREEPEFERV